MNGQEIFCEHPSCILLPFKRVLGIISHSERVQAVLHQSANSGGIPLLSLTLSLTLSLS